MEFSQDLLLKVYVRNRLNKKANDVQAEIVHLLLPYVNKKVTKQGATWTKEVSKILEPIKSRLSEEGFGYILRFELSSYNVRAILETSYATDNGRWKYVKTDFPICSLSSHILTSVAFMDSRRYDYTVEEVVATREKIMVLDQQVRDLRYIVREFSGS